MVRNRPVHRTISYGQQHWNFQTVFEGSPLCLILVIYYVGYVLIFPSKNLKWWPNKIQ